jgi:sodium pump decarboxylase gamma subunit
MDLALNVTLVGLFVVFSALIILSVLISVSSKVFTIRIPRNKKATSNSNTDKIYQPVNNNTTIANNPQNESELIAVLTAAVMASMQQTPDFKIRIKSFRRIHKDSSAWSTAGIAEQISNRF